MCEDGLLSRNKEEWRALVKERRERMLENEADKNQLRKEQEEAELNAGEEERLEQKLKRLEATGKQLDKERSACLKHERS